MGLIKVLNFKDESIMGTYKNLSVTSIPQIICITRPRPNYVENMGSNSEAKGRYLYIYIYREIYIDI